MHEFTHYVIENRLNFGVQSSINHMLRPRNNEQLIDNIHDQKQETLHATNGIHIDKMYR